MIWADSPATGRTLATGLAALTWTAASTLALHSLTLRPSSSVHVHNDVQTPPVHVRPDIHLPQPVVERVETNGRELRSPRLTSLTAAHPVRASRAGRAEKANPQDKGIVPQPKRWRVEQTYGILILNRRLVRDYEHHAASSVSRVYWAMTHTMTRRLTGATTPTWHDPQAVPA